MPVVVGRQRGERCRRRRSGLRPMPKSLVAMLAVEVAVFSLMAQHFLSIANAAEVVRLGIELGLLSVAITPVIVTGGIDLSIGSMLGLSAVVMGAAYREWHFSIAGAIAAALAVGCAGGALNALLVASLRVPPLIVTLGTLSLFRGIAEGMTHAAVNYSGFPEGFLQLGQGYLWGVIPAQMPIFVLVFALYAILLHRSVVGRALYTIGLAPSGAQYAGLPVARRLALVYVLSGLIASVAAIVYVAHLGQARADAGVGYELDAITAVVLGGASVFGGRGTLWGTLAGLAAVVILQNGLHLAALPSELTGVLTGVLLIVTILGERLRRSQRVATAHAAQENTAVKNSQVAVICASVLVGAAAITLTNIWLVRTITSTSEQATLALSSGPPRRLVIGMMPKAKGDPYFVSCRAGAEEAARELGVDLIWDGPTSLDAARQNEIVENWITRRVDAIAVAVENRAAISTVLRKARERGIHVLTWDADAEADARDYFVNQATSEGIGNTLTDEAARLLDGRGEFAVITGALSAANQNEWISFIRKRLAEKYPNVKLMMAISAPAVPGSAEAVRQAGRRDIKVIGLSLPNINKPYVHDGIVQTVVLWNTRD